MARDWLGSENSSPSLPNAISKLCLPTSIAAFTPLIALLLTAAGAPTPPCVLIRARRCAAAPSTVRVLLRVIGCVASCCLTASLGPGGLELTHPVLLLSGDSSANIQGGHRGNFLSDDMARQVGTFALVPQIVDAVRVPVIAAGGIADARGIVAALALGASAVQIGTAYLFCPEAKVPALHLEALKHASDDDTM